MIWRWLNGKRGTHMFHHWHRETHGFRWFWHLGRSVVSVEFYWWSLRCLLAADVDDEGWTFGAALPPFTLFLSLNGFGLWKPREKHIFTWDNNREVWLTAQREFRFAIHYWTIWFTPWGRSMEYLTADPWWVRGVSLNLKDVVVGRWRYTCETIGPTQTVMIPMPEGVYLAEFTPQRQTWKRPRWFTYARESFDIKIPKGIPFAGKGENSWDCGDDGLFGMGAEGTITEAVECVRQTVLERRRRYGQPSAEAITEAMA